MEKFNTGWSCTFSSAPAGFNGFFVMVCAYLDRVAPGGWWEFVACCLGRHLRLCWTHPWGNQAGAEQGTGGFLGIRLGCFPQAALPELFLPLRSAFCTPLFFFLFLVSATGQCSWNAKGVDMAQCGNWKVSVIKGTERPELMLCQNSCC